MSHKLVGPEVWRTYPRREFAAWFNQLEGLRSSVLVGTQSSAGQTNLAVFSSLTHVGARPPLVGLVFRPLTVERHTYENLRATGFYTINHLPVARIGQGHRTSAKLPRGESEFAAVGLTAAASSAAAPYVAEASVSMLCEFAEEHLVASNDTRFVVGAVRELRLPAGAVFGGERVDWTALGATVVSGLYDYYSVRFERKERYVES